MSGLQSVSNDGVGKVRRARAGGPVHISDRGLRRCHHADARLVGRTTSGVPARQISGTSRLQPVFLFLAEQLINRRFIDNCVETPSLFVGGP